LNSGNARNCPKRLLDKPTLGGARAEPNNDNRIEKYSNIMETGNFQLGKKPKKVILMFPTALYRYSSSFPFLLVKSTLAYLIAFYGKPRVTRI
jgi:hypothetical protein